MITENSKSVVSFFSESCSFRNLSVTQRGSIQVTRDCPRATSLRWNLTSHIILKLTLVVVTKIFSRIFFYSRFVLPNDCMLLCVSVPVNGATCSANTKFFLECNFKGLSLGHTAESCRENHAIIEFTRAFRLRHSSIEHCVTLDSYIVTVAHKGPIDFFVAI